MLITVIDDTQYMNDEDFIARRNFYSLNLERLKQKEASLKSAKSELKQIVKIYWEETKQYKEYVIEGQLATSVIADFNIQIYNKIVSLKDSIVKEMENVRELANAINLDDERKEITGYISKFNDENILYSEEIRFWVSRIRNYIINYQYNFIKNIPQNYRSNFKGVANANLTGYKSIQSWKENLLKIWDEIDKLKANL